MRVEILTLFPGMFEGPFDESIVGRARQAGLVSIRIIDLRDYTHDRHRSVDDRPYGGGAGMVLKPEPLFEAVRDLRTEDARVVLLTPQGERFTQARAEDLSQCPHLILVCGHYEGVDERARQCLMDHEISVGDYVLTSGNLAAMVVTDAVVRLIPGVLGCSESSVAESFGEGMMLEYPQYTRPEVFEGMHVPDILLSGDHTRIDAWRSEQRLVRTAARRPDLLSS